MSNAAEKIDTTEMVPSRAAPPTAPQSETAIVLNMIERMARDPDVNIEKVREFMAMRKEMLADEAQQKFNDGMALAQSEMRAVATDANNPQTKSKYASYYALDKVVRPIYTKHGFALSFDTEPSTQQDHILVVCYVTCAGHTRKYRVDMPADGKGAKGGDVMTKTHAAGSAMTYGQRYLLKAIFNIAIGGDDDGNGAGQRKEQVSDEAADKMRETVRELVTEMKMDLTKFLVWAKAPSIADIPGADLKDIIASLQERKRKLGAKS